MALSPNHEEMKTIEIACFEAHVLTTAVDDVIDLYKRDKFRLGAINEWLAVQREERPHMGSRRR
jgi:hypothetical protein